MKIIQYGNEVQLKSNAINEVGNRYGSIVVVAPVRIKGISSVRWHCKCDCGNDGYFKGSELRSGKRTSCGARCNVIADMEIGSIYWYLKILKRDNTPAVQFSDQCVHWICECQLCGTIKSFSGKNLRDVTTKSCGCMKSYGEQLIAKALLELNIPYEKEYSFSDLLGKNNNPYRFDFAIFNKETNKLQFLIEFNGVQHFKDTMLKWSDLEYRQEIDQIKQDYCRDNGINRINFNSYGNHQFKGSYEEILTEIQQFYNKTKESKNYVQVLDYNFGNL